MNKEKLNKKKQRALINAHREMNGIEGKYARKD